MANWRQRLATVVAAMILFVGFSWLIELWRVPTPPAGVAALAAARALVDDARDPPAAGRTDWQAVALPWTGPPGPASPAVAWFEIDLELAQAPSDLKAVFLRRPLTNATVYVNNRLIGDAGSMRKPLPYYIADLRFVVPPGLLRAGSNRILIRSVRERRAPYLGAVWVGDAGTLATFKSRTATLGRHGIRFVVAATLILALVHAAFWAVRPRETAYGWFAAALAMWALHCAWPQFDTPPIEPTSLWRPVAFVSLGWFVVFAAIFVHRLTGLVRPTTERTLLGAAATGSVALWALAMVDHAGFVPFAESIWVPAINLLGIYIGVCLLHALGRQGGAELQVVATVALFLVMVGLRDYLFDRGLLGSSVGRHLPFAAPIVLVTFGAILLRRFVRALDESERVNRELEARVAAKSAELAANYARLSALEGERARIDERERLMRDMHDGIGGQLVQALAMTEQRKDGADVAEVLRASLDDLRLLIDTSAPEGEDLGTLLAGLRSRLRRRLEVAGLRVEWPLDAGTALPRLTPHRALQFVRILQEAVANVLKHARARTIRIECRVHASADGVALQLEVADDGRGFSVATAQGRGIDNMRRRAAELGGTLSISADRGTCVRLLLPIDRS